MARRSRRSPRRTLTIAAAALGILLLASGVAAWRWGPVLGAVTRGKPLFVERLVGADPSPRRYAAAVIGAAERMGLDRETPGFTQAKDEAEAAIARLDAAGELRTPADVHGILHDVLRAAGGKHSGLSSPKHAAEAADPGAAEMPVVGREGDVAVIRLPSILGDAGPDYARVGSSALLDELAAGARGVVVDLRGNGGGDMGPMVAAVAPVLPDGDLLWFRSSRGETPVTLAEGRVNGGGTPSGAAAPDKYDVPVAVLVDGGTASSAEATMLAFRGLDRSRSFGAPTAGYASANIAIAMPDGAVALLTAGEDRARTGEVFRDDPIRPDVAVDGDPLGAALRWLAEA